MASQQGRFGERLRRYREAAGFSQEELAERAGLSANAISALERGERKRPYPDTLRRLADALGLSDGDRAALAEMLGKPDATHVPREVAHPSRSVMELPGEVTPLIGRAHEADVVRYLLGQPESRLLTLTGPGGVGKTRLALHVARAVSDEYADGVAWVELAPIGNPALVVSTIFRSLGLQEPIGGDPLETLRAWLRERRVLLVLDNVEHLLEAAKDIADLLRACPGLRVLATSRAPLNIRGEQEYVVPPLELPPAGPLGDHDVATVSAVQLFVWYARQKQPSFALTADNTAAVVGICRRLDGLPLALELAAARIRALSAAELLARLDHLLPLLTGGSQDLPQRQQTMRAAIGWSNDLLTPAEQALFRRLSVFAGGWTLAAAETVTAWGTIEPDDVIDLLTSLVEQSLVVAEARPEGGSRYRMLEPIRQFAAHLVEETGEKVELHDHHLAWYLTLAQHAKPELVGPDQQHWLDRLEQEHDNLRVALTWSQEHAPSRTSGLRLAVALWGFWSTRGHLAEGRRWLESMLAAADDAPADVRATALNAAGNLADDQGDFAHAAKLIEEALELRRSLGNKEDIAISLNDLGNVALNEERYEHASALYGQALDLFREIAFDRGMAFALHNMGLLARNQGRYEQAASLLDEALLLWERLGDTASRARSLNVLAVVMRRQGDLDRAESLHQQSLALRQSLGDTRGVAVTLWNYGAVLRYQRKYAEATRLIEESLRLHRLIGDQPGVAGSLLALADVARCDGDTARASRLYKESIALRRELGVTDGIADCLLGLAAVVSASGDNVAAARLLGASEALREETSQALAPIDRDDYERTVARIRESVPLDTFERAREEGRTLPLDQLVGKDQAGRP